jgi:hypothetical protein
VIRAWWSSRSSKSSPRHSVPGGGFDSHPLRQFAYRRFIDNPADFTGTVLSLPSASRHRGWPRYSRSIAGLENGATFPRAILSIAVAFSRADWHQDRWYERLPTFALTSTRRSLDTAGSALTGRHQPAAREHSHLFGLSRVRVHLLSAWFSAGYRRLMKGGRNGGFEVSSRSSVSRVPS